MCIAAFIWQAHPLYPFLLLLNRDEYHNRPTKPLAWWDGGEILGGTDVLAGGTWLASCRDGRVAFLTNVRELRSLPNAKSIGDLVVRYLQAQRLGHNCKHLLDMYGKDEIPIKETAEKLMRDTVKDDESMLPRIYPPEWEHHLSSIFVEGETPKGRYGTSSISALAAKTNGEMSFYESHLENNSWKEQTVTYQIEKLK